MTSKWESGTIANLVEEPLLEVAAEPWNHGLITVRLHAKGLVSAGKSPNKTGSARKHYFRRSGQILIGRQNFNRQCVGMVDDALDGLVTSNAISAFVPRDGVDATYALLLLQSPFIAETADRLMPGTGQREISTKTLLSIPIAIPPFAEQRRIVDLIGALDDAIEAAEEKKDILERLRPQLLDSALNSCDTVLLEELLVGISAGKSPAAENKAPADNEYGVLKVGAVNMWGFIATEAKTLDDTSEFSESMKVKAGDLLMTRANTAEKVGAVCFAETGYDHLYLCDKTLRLEYGEGVDPRCLAAVLNSEQVRSQIQLAGTGTSASMKNISQKSINRLRVPWPQSVDEQRVVGELDSALLCSVSESAEYLLSLRTLRSELLTALLSGSHEVPESYDSVMELADA